MRGATKADFFFSGKTQRIEVSSLQNFPVDTYSCESWTIKKTEHPRIDPFELWCWRRLLKIPWIARRSNQSKLLKEINPEYSLEGLMLKLPVFSHPVIWCKQKTHWKSPWYWERLRAEGEEGVRGWDGWMASPMQWTWTWENSRRWWATGRSGMLESMGGHKESDVTGKLNNKVCRTEKNRK